MDVGGIDGSDRILRSGDRCLGGSFFFIQGTFTVKGRTMRRGTTPACLPAFAAFALVFLFSLIFANVFFVSCRWGGHKISFVVRTAHMPTVFVGY